MNVNVLFERLLEPGWCSTVWYTSSPELYLLAAFGMISKLAQSSVHLTLLLLPGNDLRMYARGQCQSAYCEQAIPRLASTMNGFNRFACPAGEKGSSEPLPSN